MLESAAPPTSRRPPLARPRGRPLRRHARRSARAPAAASVGVLATNALLPYSPARKKRTRKARRARHASGRFDRTSCSPACAPCARPAPRPPPDPGGPYDPDASTTHPVAFGVLRRRLRSPVARPRRQWRRRRPRPTRDLPWLDAPLGCRRVVRRRRAAGAVFLTRARRCEGSGAAPREA